MPEPMGVSPSLNLSPDERDELLGQLAEEFERRIRSGECPRILDYSAAHPEIAADIEDVFSAILALEGIKSDAVRDDSGRVSLGGWELQQLGEFRIVREISRGGMGIVYEAEQTTLNRRVALKVLPRHLPLEGESKAQFEQEARLAASLHHSNIVPVYGCGEEDGFYFYAMQLIEGKPPGDHADGTPWTAVRLAEIGLQVADALEYAHQQGVLHRDIKPSNLIEDDQHRIWLTDFGLASSARQFQKGQAGGTLKYMAPERAQGICNAATDVYSLGVTLSEVAAGKNLRLPRDLQAVIGKAADSDFQTRYATSLELADDLRRFLAHRPVKARRMNWAGRLAKTVRRNPGVSACLALMLVLAWGAAFVSHRNYRESLRQNERITRSLFTVDALLRSNTAGAERVVSSRAHRGTVRAGEVQPSTTRPSSMLQHFFPDVELESLLRTSPELLLTATQSRRQVGRAQMQLGNLDEARLALQYSLDSLSQIRNQSPHSQDSSTAPSDYLLPAAQLHNDLADIAELQLDFKSADAHRRQALVLVDDMSDASVPDALIERGRARLGLGAWRPARHGLFGRWEELEESSRQVEHDSEVASAVAEHLDEAIHCFAQYQGDPTRRVLLLARGHLERANYRRAMDLEWQQDDERAIRALDELFRESPRNPDCRYLLAVALANVPMRPDVDDDNAMIAQRRRLERAQELSYSLTRSHPQHALFVEAEVEVRHKLAELLMCEGNADEAVEHLRMAISYQKTLSHRFPQRLSTRIDLALFKWRLRQLLLKTGKTESAGRFRDRALRQFEFIHSTQEFNPVVIAAREVLDGTRPLVAIPEFEPIVVTEDTNR